MKRFNYDYKIGDKFMMRNKAAYKYETLYKVPYEKIKRGPMKWSHYK